MSTLWTPDGERRVGRPDEPVSTPGGASGGGAPGTRFDPDADEATMAAQVEAMRAELAQTPVEVVVANHCYGLFELAAVYLSQQPPLLDQARLAIDGLACMVDGLRGRLGDTEEQLRDGLSQLQLAYVQIDGAARASEAAAADAGANGGAPPGGSGSSSTADGPSTPPGG